MNQRDDRGPRDRGRPQQDRPERQQPEQQQNQQHPQGSRFDAPPPRPPRRPEQQQAPQDQPPPRDRQQNERPRYPEQSRPRQDGPPQDRSFRPRNQGDQRPRPDRPPRAERVPPPPDVVSGLHAVEGLLRWQPRRVQLLYVWASDARVQARMQELAKTAGVRVENQPPRGFEHETQNPQGVGAKVTPFEYADLERVLPLEGPADGSLFVCLDSITDPRNLGAILRSAAFFRVTAVIFPQDRAAEVTPLVERIAEGGAAVVPVVQVVNLARTLGSLRDRGVEVVGTALDGATGDLRTHVWTRTSALVLGAEGTGIRPLVRKNCDVLVTLPGPEQMPSLNVSAFATLAMALARSSPALRIG